MGISCNIISSTCFLLFNISTLWIHQHCHLPSWSGKELPIMNSSMPIFSSLTEINLSNSNITTFSKISFIIIHNSRFCQSKSTEIATLPLISSNYPISNSLITLDINNSQIFIISWIDSQISRKLWTLNFHFSQIREYLHVICNIWKKTTTVLFQFKNCEWFFVCKSWRQSNQNGMSTKETQKIFKHTSIIFFCVF